MRIQIFNKQTNSLITFIGAKHFKNRTYCGWNDLTPEQELQYGQFVIIDTLGFDTIQTPENDLYSLWNVNGKFLSSSYWGTRLLTISFVNQNHATSSVKSVANLFYKTLKCDDEPLHMTVVDDFNASYFCEVVLNKPNTNQTEDSITFEMLSDTFTSMMPFGESYEVGLNKMKNGQINTAPSLQLPMSINNPKNKRGELEFDRDVSNYVTYPAGLVISFVNTSNTDAFRFVNADGTTCVVSVFGTVEADRLVYIDPKEKAVYISGIVVESFWLGDIKSGAVRFDVTSPTTVTMCEKTDVGVIHL